MDKVLKMKNEELLGCLLRLQILHSFFINFRLTQVPFVHLLYAFLDFYFVMPS